MPTLRSTMQDYLQGWQSDVAQSWRTLLHGVEPAYDDISGSLTVRDGEVVFPGRKGDPPEGARPDGHVFRALDGITPGRVRVVILGQDPYPKIAQATGRSFEQGDLESWTTGRPAPSLKRILQEAARFRTGRAAYRKRGGWRALVDDIEAGDPEFAAPRALFDAWQRQGVLFLNTGLTLTRYRPGGHPHQMRGHIPLWAPVVGALCFRLAGREDVPLVFLAWGKKARTFLARAGILHSDDRPARVVEELPNTGIVDRDHPAVASFFNEENLFAEANSQLEEFGADPIDW